MLSLYLLYRNIVSHFYLFKQLSTLGEANLAPAPTKAGSKKTTAPLSTVATESRKRKKINRPVLAGVKITNIEDDALEGLNISKKK